MPIIDDDEFGRISVRRSSRSRSMRASIAPNGTLRVAVPSYAPLFMVKRMIHSSRTELRKLISSRPKITLTDGMQVGKSHSLHVRNGVSTSVRITGQQLILSLGPSDDLADDHIIHMVREHMRRLLRKEAKAHLPRRIAHLAQQHGYRYEKLRFTHASSRWGSCSSTGTISLNIALMNLPFELIDYVLLHELAHTVHMNHSKDFWAELSRGDSAFKAHKAQLRQYNPDI